jgi:poly(A) polymerase
MIDFRLTLPEMEAQVSRFTHISQIAAALSPRFNTYLVGGAVRDMHLGLPAKDLDLATDAYPEEIIEALAPVADKVLEVGVEFGTVVAVFGEDRYEVTTFRGDVYNGETRKPTVTYTESVLEDLSRRDFTINAMAMSLNVPPPLRTIIDPFGGRQDLADGVLRTPGDPRQSFMDDPLRMMRAARFIARFGLSDNDIFLDVAKKHDELRRVSVERIRDELLKLLLVEDPTEGLDFLGRTGLSDVFLPELNALRMEDEAGGYKDVYTHTFAVVRNTPVEPLLRLSALFHDIAKPATFARVNKKVSFHRHEVLGARMTEDVMRRLKFDNDTTRDVVELVRLHLRAHGADAWTDKAVRRYIADAGPLLRELNILQRADVTTKSPAKQRRMAKHMDDLEERIAHIQFVEGIEPIKPPLDGRQIMDALNIAPGPEVGRLRQALLDYRLDHGPMTEVEAKTYLFELVGVPGDIGSQIAAIQ